MNHLSRVFLTAVTTLVLATPAVFAQEAVERLPATSTEPAPEIAPAPTENPEATPVPKKKKAAPVEETTTAAPAAAEQPAPAGAKVTAKTLGMTQSQFKAAGLDKLSQPELQALAVSMGKQRQEVETQATQKATAKAQQEAQAQIKQAAKQRIDTVESRVASGAATRLTGHSIITLEDGTSWKQAMADDHYPGLAAEHPMARVEHTSWGWKMTVAGWPAMYVDPVR